MVRTVALVEASVQPGGRAPAPDSLALVQAFVNTVDREHGPDLLDAAPTWAAWLGYRDLPETDRERAREVREALRALLWANGGDAAVDVAAAAAVLDRSARGLRARFAPPARLQGADAVDAVLAAVFAAMLDGSWERLKACPGDRCGWAFYDRSVNGSATWCSMRICGNRAKAKAYYRRRR